MWGRMIDRVNLESRLFESIEVDRDRIIRLLRELVQIPTVNPPGEKYLECVHFLETTLREQGIKTNIVNVPRKVLIAEGIDLPRPSLLATVEGTDHNRTLNLNGHYDVVPAGGGWSADPFGASVSDGKVFGRGTSDMKGSVAALVMAATALQRSQERFKETWFFRIRLMRRQGGDLGRGTCFPRGTLTGITRLLRKGASTTEATLFGIYSDSNL